MGKSNFILLENRKISMKNTVAKLAPIVAVMLFCSADSEALQ